MATHAYKKRLEGVQSTKGLHALIQGALQSASPGRANKGKNVENDGSSSAVTRATAMLPDDEARAILENYDKQTDHATISLDVLKSMRSIFASDEKKMAELEKAVTNTTFVFTSPPVTPKETNEQRRFRKRLDKLKLGEEATRYIKLTGNLDVTVADDVTTKSMTYAASVGLNMIVAPISFGVLMYFFAGQIFTWLIEDETSNPQAAQARRIIAGVVSGVAMLFIEMILFVIRTHEFDKANRKKAKKKTPSPFGHVKPTK